MNKSPDAPDSARRMILKGAIAGGLAGLGFAGSSVLSTASANADAKDWPPDAFKQKSEADAIKTLYGKTAEASDKVTLDAPEIAENGAVVPIAVIEYASQRHGDRHPGTGKSVCSRGSLQDSRPARRPQWAIG